MKFQLALQVETVKIYVIDILKILLRKSFKKTYRFVFVKVLRSSACGRTGAKFALGSCANLKAAPPNFFWVLY